MREVINSGGELMPSKIPYIEWDNTKCHTPMACKICFNGCPTGVLRCYWRTPMRRGYEADVNEPDGYQIIAEWIDQCTGCMWCVEKCPEKALKVEFR